MARMAAQSATLAQGVSQVRDIVRSHLGPRACTFLYGSCAHGNATRTSDVDVGILPLQPIAPSELSELRHDLEQSNILLQVDLVDLSRTDAEFREKVLKDAMEWTD